MAIPQFQGYVNSSVEEFAALEKNVKIPGAREFIPGAPIAYDNPVLADLQKVPAKYYLEIRRGGQIDAVTSFPYDPSEVSYSRANPVQVTRTMGGVIREFNTIRSHSIQMSGRSGIAHRIGYNRRGQIIYTPGQTIFNEFDEFLKRYQELQTMAYGIPSRLIRGNQALSTDSKYRVTLGADAAAIQMILRCIDEDLHLLVEPQSFGWRKSAEGARFDCFWSIGFDAYGYPQQAMYRNPVAQVLDRWDQICGLVGGYVGMVSNLINNVSNEYIGRVRSSINNTTGTMGAALELANSINGVWHNAVGIVADVYRLGQQAKRIGDRYTQIDELFANSITQIDLAQSDFEAQRVGRGVETVRQTEEQVQLVRWQGALSSAPPINERNDDVVNYELGLLVMAQNQMHQSLEIMRGNIPLEIYRNSERQNATSLEEIRGAFLANENNFGKLYPSGLGLTAATENYDRDLAIVYNMKQHEDLKSVASKFLGTTDRWEEIMRFNGWRDARRDQHGDYPTNGKQVLVPREIVGTHNRFNKQGDLVGYDLYTEWDDLTFDNNGDLQVVGGLDNIKQSIKNVLMTKLGEIYGYNNYGFPDVLDVADVAYTSSVLRDTLVSDPRIIDASNIVVEVDENDSTRLNISCDVQTIELDKFSVKTPIKR